MLKVAITNERGLPIREHRFECLERPGLDGETFDAIYVINLVKAASERGKYLSEFPKIEGLDKSSLSFELADAARINHLNNVNELWFEIENLMSGARLNFAHAEIFNHLQSTYQGDTGLDKQVRYNLHFEKMDRFHLAVFEMARVEDLVVRMIYDFFGEQFIDGIDESKNNWEKMLTWDRMKDALNTRGKPRKNLNQNSEQMDQEEYDELMRIIRGYRSEEVLKLLNYRDRRTHRATPSVDYPELSADVFPVGVPTLGNPFPLFPQRNCAEFKFSDLYENAKKVYTQLHDLLVKLNKIIHA